jgi:ketosteroid isomerase-like protein
MWHRFALILVLSGAAAVPAFAQQAGSEQKLQQEIEAVFNNWLEAFNRGDGKAAAAFFVANAPAINPNGVVRVTGQEYANRVQMQHQQNFNTTAMIDQIQAIGSDAAYALGPWTSTFGPNGGGRSGGLWLQLYERRADPSHASEDRKEMPGRTRVPMQVPMRMRARTRRVADRGRTRKPTRDGVSGHNRLDQFARIGSPLLKRRPSDAGLRHHALIRPFLGRRYGSASVPVAGGISRRIPMSMCLYVARGQEAELRELAEDAETLCDMGLGSRGGAGSRGSRSRREFAVHGGKACPHRGDDRAAAASAPGARSDHEQGRTAGGKSPYCGGSGGRWQYRLGRARRTLRRLGRPRGAAPGGSARSAAGRRSAQELAHVPFPLHRPRPGRLAAGQLVDGRRRGGG